MWSWTFEAKSGVLGGGKRHPVNESAEEMIDMLMAGKPAGALIWALGSGDCAKAAVAQGIGLQ